MEYNNENLARGLRVRMAELQVTETQLWKKTGIARTTLSCIKNDKWGSPRLNTLNEICKALQIDLEDLFIEPRD